MQARVHDGITWIDVAEGGGAGNTGNQVPVPPVFDGDGNIFVSLPSFRGTSISAGFDFICGLASLLLATEKRVPFLILPKSICFAFN